MERLQKFIEQHDGVWINDGDKNIIINLKFEDALEFTRLHVIAALDEASKQQIGWPDGKLHDIFDDNVNAIGYINYQEKKNNYELEKNKLLTYNPKLAIHF